MTEQEAINILQLNTPFVASKEANEAVELAIKALEKQIPKMPLSIPTDDTCLYYKLRCPTCDAYMSGVIKMHHCKCGQALDWK